MAFTSFVVINCVNLYRNYQTLYRAVDPNKIEKSPTLRASTLASTGNSYQQFNFLMLGKSEDLVLAMTISSVSLAMVLISRGSFCENSCFFQLEFQFTFKLSWITVYTMHSSLPLGRSIPEAGVHQIYITKVHGKRRDQNTYVHQNKKNEPRTRNQMSNGMGIVRNPGSIEKGREIQYDA